MEEFDGNVAELSEAQWATVNAKAVEIMNGITFEEDEERNLEIVSGIHNQQAYFNVTDELDCGDPDEEDPDDEANELQRFYDVLDAVIDAALCGESYVVQAGYWG